MMTGIIGGSGSARSQICRRAIRAVTRATLAGRPTCGKGRATDAESARRLLESTRPPSLAKLYREFGERWEIEPVPPGAKWIAVLRESGGDYARHHRPRRPRAAAPDQLRRARRTRRTRSSPVSDRFTPGVLLAVAYVRLIRYALAFRGHLTAHREAAGVWHAGRDGGRWRSGRWTRQGRRRPGQPRRG
jgi:hypothetical protein